MLVEPVVALVIALACYRVARAITADSIFEGWRAKLEDWAYVPDPQTGEKLWYRDVTVGHRKATIAHPSGEPRRSRMLTLLRGKFADLMMCPLCLGFHCCWVALCVWTALWPWELGWKGWTLVFALAGVQYFLTTVDGEFRKQIKVED